MNEFASSNFPFGVSNGGVDGAGASAPILLSGTALTGDVIEARVRQGGSTIVDWHTIGTASNTNWAFKTSRVPRGVGYTAEVRLQRLPSAVRTMTATFDVCDLVVYTGSSSAENQFITDSGSGITAFTDALKLYNGNNPVVVVDQAKGGAVLHAAQSTSNTYFYPLQADTSLITDWTGFGDNDNGTALKNYIDARGGEITAFLDASGANDNGLVGNAEAIRIYKIAQSRKFKYARSIAGRIIPFIQQQMGVRRNGATAGPDDAQQRNKRAQREMETEYSTEYFRGGAVWDQPLLDSQHHANYITIAQRNARVIATQLGYVSGLQLRGAVITSVSKTGAREIVATLSVPNGTAITPSSGMTGWRVRSNGVTVAPSSVSVGTVTDGVCTITLAFAADLNAPTTVAYLYGDGLSVTTSTDFNTINPLVAQTGKDNATFTLPIEWFDEVTV